MKIAWVLLLVACSGCVGISYTSTTVYPGGQTNIVQLRAQRFIWSTESYIAQLNTNGTGSLTVSKSSVDNVALGNILSVIGAATKAAP